MHYKIWSINKGHTEKVPEKHSSGQRLHRHGRRLDLVAVRPVTTSSLSVFRQVEEREGEKILSFTRAPRAPCHEAVSHFVYRPKLHEDRQPVWSLAGTL
jgi:hypothetical protein